MVLCKTDLEELNTTNNVGSHSVALHGGSGHGEAVLVRLEALLGVAFQLAEKLHTETGLQ